MPIAISLRLAWKQGIEDQKREGMRYASEVLRRCNETSFQFERAIRLLNNDHFAHCSPQEIDLMRQIDVGSSYIQMVGRISGNTLECTSLGTTKPMDMGKPTLMTVTGTAERINVSLGPNQLDRLDLVDQHGVAVLVDSSLVVDIPKEGDDVELAVFVPSTPNRERLGAVGSNFRPKWFEPAAKGAVTSYIDGDSVVSQARSGPYDYAAISVIPSRYAYHYVRQFALIFIPVGLSCGLLLGWAVLYISRARSSIPALVRAAARNQEFSVEYQPIVEMATRRLVGAEALVRWKRGGTWISPANFIPLAEESGVITQITDSVIRMVARDLPKLLEADTGFRVSINLSPADLAASATEEKLKELLRRSGAEPRNLVVEATESGFLQGSDTRAVIAGIRRQGIHVAIDDFGTGYSSLACLQTLEIDVMKIDKAFVETIGTDGPTSQVVQHIIEIGHSMNMMMAAEGVETEAQAGYLHSRGVQFGQGWLFGRPMSVDALRRKLDEQNADAMAAQLTA
ncbi:MAG TPA: EAL domain-containing protein [Terracidiphilus sp.]|nr:EAL domain-containing protein [Terracidiphilus sp.]